MCDMRMTSVSVGHSKNDHGSSGRFGSSLAVVVVEEGALDEEA